MQKIEIVMDPKSNFQSADYRKALGTFATGITVVTAVSSNGEPVGLTANSFTSVSLDPPLILWCLATTSDSLNVFRNAPWFAVNILAADQRGISEHFAKKQKNKFNPVRFRNGNGGVPLLEGCATWLQCRLIEQYVAGDHHIFIGQVEHIETTGREALLYHQGAYVMSLPLPETPAGGQTDCAGTMQQKWQDLYSLLAGAAHSYQERFETGQSSIVDNPYEARLLLLLHEGNANEVTELASSIQVPKAEAEVMINEMQSRGLLEFDANGQYIELTASGAGKAAALRRLAKQHETDALALLGSEHAETFRRNLLRLIDWDQKPPSGK